MGTVYPRTHYGPCYTTHPWHPLHIAIDLYIQRFLHSETSIDKALMTPFFQYVHSLPTDKWSHEATIHLLKQFCAMISVGRVCYAELLRLMFLRFISSRHHPFLRAMSPSGQQVGGNRWLSHAR